MANLVTQKPPNTDQNDDNITIIQKELNEKIKEVEQLAKNCLVNLSIQTDQIDKLISHVNHLKFQVKQNEIQINITQERTSALEKPANDSDKFDIQTFNKMRTLESKIKQLNEQIIFALAIGGTSLLFWFITITILESVKINCVNDILPTPQF